MRDRDLKFNTLKNLWIYAEIFYTFSKKCHHHFDVELFSNSGNLLYAMVGYYLQIQQTKSTLNYRSFTKPRRGSIQSLKAMGL